MSVGVHQDVEVKAKAAPQRSVFVLQCGVVGNVPSGGDRLILELVRRWPASLGQVTFVTTTEGATQLQQLGISNPKLHILPSFRFLGGKSAAAIALAYLMRGVAAARALNRLVRRARKSGEVPLVLSTSTFIPDLFGSASARAAGAKWLQSWQLIIPAPWSGYRQHGPDATRQIATAVRTSLSFLSDRVGLALARRFASQLVVPTEVMAEEAKAIGFSRSQIRLLSYGIDLDEVETAVRAREHLSREYDAAFIGRFHPQKGLDDLLLVWAQVRAVNASAKLVVIGGGDGPAASRFKAAIAASDSGITMLGVLTGPEKLQALARSKMLIFPSHHESWGHVVLEAMAVGLPVAGYDLPSSREVFGDTMVRVPVGDVNALSSSILRLLNDSKLRLSLIERGRLFAAGKEWGCTSEAFFRSLAAEA